MNILSVFWDVNPEIINLFGVSLRYYGILFVGGLIMSVSVLKWIFKKENIPLEKLDKLLIYGMIGIFLGARLGHCFFYEPAYFLSHPIEILLPIQLNPNGGYHFSGFQGLASHGGAIGLIIALIIYSIKTKEPIIKTIDLVAIVTPLSGCFIRLANLMNSEIIGTPTNVSWAFVFPNVDMVPRHPSQLYEAIIYLLIFGLLIFLYKTKRTVLQNGFFFGLSIFFIFMSRFFIEFVKERQVAFEENMKLDMGQLLSIPFILLGVGFMIYSRYGTFAKEKDN